jgi:hypothetical protein
LVGSDSRRARPDARIRHQVEVERSDIIIIIIIITTTDIANINLDTNLALGFAYSSIQGD